MEFRISIKKKIKKYLKIGLGMFYFKLINIFNYIYRDFIQFVKF